MSEKRKQHFLTLLLLLTTMLGTIGCKQQSNGDPIKEKSVSSGNDQKGYLNSDTNGAMFIRWTEINNKLNGQMTIFYAKGKRGKNTATSTHPFEGISDGKNISLNFTGSRWTDALGGKTWTGTVADNDLTLVIPDASGMLMPVKFRTGTVEEYNRVVLGVKQDVSDENARVQTEDAETARKASEKKAVVATYDKVRHIAIRLSDNLKSLQEDSRYDDIVKAYSNTWEKMQSNYSSLKDKAAKSPLTSTQFYNVQSALYTLQSDIYSMDSNDYSMQNKRNSINDKIKTVEEYITELQKAWGQFQQAKAVNTTGEPEITVTNEQISEIIGKAQDEVAKAKTAMNEALKKTSAFDKQARDLYKRAELFVKSLKPSDQ